MFGSVKTDMYKYLFLFFLILSGCTEIEAPQEFPDTPGDDMDPMTQRALAEQQRMQWGQSRTFQAPWQERETRAVLNLDRVPRPFPTSKAIILSAEDLSPPTAFSSNHYIYRWRLTAGVGGGSAVYVFDAARLQQIALPSDTARLELFCESPTIGGGALAIFNSPTYPVAVSAFIADQPTFSSPAVYSQHISVTSGGGTVDLPVPAGATSLIISPTDAIALAAGTTYELQGNTSPIQFWTGVDLTPLSARIQPIPVPGSARLLHVVNGGIADALFWVLWQLDL